MKITSLLSIFVISVMATVTLGLVFAPSYVSAVDAGPAPSDSSCDPDTEKGCVYVCGSSDPSDGGVGEEDKCNDFIEKYINPIIKVLTALIGIAAVISIIIAGIQYSTSADDSGAVTKAKQRIFNVVLGLVAYIFLLAFLNWLIPGGVF